MAKTLQQVQKQIDQLQKEAEVLRKREAAGVLARIREAIEVYGFTAADLGFAGARTRSASAGPTTGRARRKTRGAAGDSKPKFKDAQGNVWGGRGPRPAWFRAALEAGKTPDELLA